MRGLEHVPWLYDAVMSVSDATGLDRWRRWLARGARGRTLEVGCGTGRNLPHYPGDVEVVGLDVDLESLRKARRRAPDVPLVCASAEALPFRDGALDTVVSGLVFCSVPDAQKGLAEVHRVLVPEGRLRMLEHVRAHRRLWAWLQDRVQPVWTWATGGCHPNRDTEAAVEAAGFDIEPEGRRAEGVMRRFSARRREGPLSSTRTGQR